MPFPRSLSPRLAGVALLCLPGAAYAQDVTSDNAIRVTTVLHEDGTKTVTQTDPEAHTSQASTYDGRDRLQQKIVYQLDDHNQPETGIVYTAANKPVFKASYKHDEMNRVSEEDDFTMDDQLMRRFVYEFGPDGKVSRIRAYDSQGNELQQTDARKDRSQVPPRRRR